MLHHTPLTLLSRRMFVAAGGAALLAPAFSASAAPQLRLDGLFDEPWLFNPSGDLGKDFAAVTKSGKNFAILWEMRGCPWCKRLHLEIFSRPEIASYVRDNFGLLQMNLRGQTEVKDFDGERLTEESVSLKHEVNATPTFQFFKPSDASFGGELGRVGYVEPDKFLLALRFVRERGYETGNFEDWAKSHKAPA
ncbi:MAG: thioredoxin family protein [Rhodomicrobium sp.]